MAATHTSGPDIIYGALMNLQGAGGAGTGGSNPEAGPSGTYQGDCLLDPRMTYQPGITGRGKVLGFLDSPYICMTDAVPAAYGAAKVAAAQAGTSGTALTLAAAPAAGITPNAPIVPFGQQLKAQNVVTALALDFGFATCSVTAASPVITAISRIGLLAPGVCVVVGGGPGNTCVAATVLSVAGNTATLDTNMGVTLAGAALAIANGSGQNVAGGSNAAPVPPVAFSPYLVVGALSVFDPTQGLCRGLSVTSNNAADAGWSVTVTSYDLYGALLHETIPVTANGVAYGWKAHKFIVSVVPSKGGGGITTGTLSIGTSDLFGVNLREDYWESANHFWNGAYLTASTGWTAADATAPATAATKDVRGTFQVSAIGPNGAGASAKASDGATRLTMYQTLHPYALFGATPANTVPLFGVPQA